VLALRGEVASLKKRLDALDPGVQLRVVADRFSDPEGSPAMAGLSANPALAGLYTDAGGYATTYPLPTRLVYHAAGRANEALGQAYISGDAIESTSLGPKIVVIGDSGDDGAAAYTILVPYIAANNTGRTLFMHRTHQDQPTTGMNVATACVASSPDTCIVIDGGGVSSMPYLPLLVFAGMFPRVSYLVLPGVFRDGAFKDLLGVHALVPNTKRRAEMEAFLARFSGRTVASYRDIVCPTTGILPATPLSHNDVKRLVADVEAWDPTTDIGLLLRAVVLVAHSPPLTRPQECTILQAAFTPVAPDTDPALRTALDALLELVPLNA
jgi:hypothetical protein